MAIARGAVALPKVPVRPGHVPIVGVLGDGGGRGDGIAVLGAAEGTMSGGPRSRRARANEWARRLCFSGEVRSIFA